MPNNQHLTDLKNQIKAAIRSSSDRKVVKGTRLVTSNFKQESVNNPVP